MTSPPTYVCPACNRGTAPWGFCRHCGSRIRQRPVAATVAPLRQGGGALLCGSCSGPLHGGTPFCPNCGIAVRTGGNKGFINRRNIPGFLVGFGGTLLIILAYPAVRALRDGTRPTDLSQRLQNHGGLNTAPLPDAASPKDDSPKPPAPPQPPLRVRTGYIRWSGRLSREGIVILSGNRVDGLQGKLLTRGLPGIPVVVFSETAGITIVRTPNLSNRWRYLVFKSRIDGQHEVVIRWESIPPRSEKSAGERLR